MWCDICTSYSFPRLGGAGGRALCTRHVGPILEELVCTCHVAKGKNSFHNWCNARHWFGHCASVRFYPDHHFNFGCDSMLSYNFHRDRTILTGSILPFPGAVVPPAMEQILLSQQKPILLILNSRELSLHQRKQLKQPVHATHLIRVTQTEDRIGGAGGKCLAIKCDIRNAEQLQAAIENTVQTFGGLDILVNNASAISLTDTQSTGVKTFDLMNQVNARGTFLASKFALPHLLKSKNPHILTLSPPLDMKPKWFKDHTAYTLAKCASTFAPQINRG